MHGSEFAELFERIVRHGKVNAVQAVLRVLVYAVEAFRAVCRRVNIQLKRSSLFLPKRKRTFRPGICPVAGSIAAVNVLFVYVVLRCVAVPVYKQLYARNV